MIFRWLGFSIACAFVLMIISCSMGPLAGGSASEGEAKVVGSVVFETTEPAESTAVTLRSIRITPSGSEMIVERKCITDKNGKFAIEKVPAGKYMLYCESEVNALGGIMSEITITENALGEVVDSLVSLDQITLKPKTVIAGRLLPHQTGSVNNLNVQVFIPGIERVTSTDNSGFYTLPGVPVGYYTIAFLYDGIINYLPVTVQNSTGHDTVYIRDVNFAADVKEADNIFSFFPHELDHSFSIVPKKYNVDQIPSWYSGKDFSMVRYYEVVDDVMKPIWRFSVIVGVSDSLVRHYGDLEAVKILLTNQMDSVNAVFNAPAVFKGTFTFAIDSVYQFSGTGMDQVALPPQGFDYRVIHDEAPPPDQVYWYNTARSMYHYYRPEIDNGLFGTYSMENMAWEFGLARGGVVLQHMDVLAENNPVNNQAYTGKQGFMYKSHESRIWDYYSIQIINYYTDEVFSENVLIPLAIPSSLGVVTRTISGTLLTGSIINCFPVSWDSWTVTDSSVLSGSTDTNGEFVFPQNPFLASYKDTVVYSNFLIQAIHGLDTAYSWLPLNDVGEAWFANPDTVCRTHIVF